MAMYILLSNLTDEGAATIKKNPGRIKEVNAELEQLGVNVLAQYATLGPYDFVNIVEGPDNETMSRVSAELGSRGSVKILTMAAIPIDDFDVDADIEIKDGVAYFREEEVTATAAELVVNGTVALEGSADLTIEGFVGPSVSQTFERFCIDLSGVKKYERMVGVPVAVRVSGPFENLSYGATTPRTVERTGEAVDSGSQQIDKAVKGVTDWFKKKK